MNDLKQLLYYTNEKDFSKELEFQEAMEVYNYGVENEHDKIFKDILNDKEEARKFINKYLELEVPIEKNNLELYNSSYITTAYKSKEADVVYKKKDQNIFFLIEHQSKIDLSMPYRIENYSIEIINTAVEKENMQKKEYLYPKVIPIVLYTGKEKWKAKLSFSDVQEKLEGYKEADRSYTIIDVNNYSEGKLLKDELFVTKVMLLEKSKSIMELIKNAKKVLETVPEDKFNKMIKILCALLGKKVGRDKTQRILDIIINKEDDVEMLDVMERIEENERKALEKKRREGIREGKIEGIRETATRMIKQGCDIDFIHIITGLKKSEIGKL